MVAGLRSLTSNMMAAIALSISVAIVSALGISADTPTRTPTPLTALETRLEQRYSDIAHVEIEDLKALAGHSDIVLVDAREPNEFSVSRIPGAVRVDPAISTDRLIERFANLIPGKKFVFYCSVGVRSSRLAARVKEELLNKGAQQVANLKGGIFAWHNEGGRLNADDGATTVVHPYNEKWGRLLASGRPRSYSPIATSGDAFQSFAPVPLTTDREAGDALDGRSDVPQTRRHAD